MWAGLSEGATGRRKVCRLSLRGLRACGRRRGKDCLSEGAVSGRRRASCLTRVRNKKAQHYIIVDAQLAGLARAFVCGTFSFSLNVLEGGGRSKSKNKNTGVSSGRERLLKYFSTRCKEQEQENGPHLRIPDSPSLTLLHYSASGPSTDLSARITHESPLLTN